MHEAERGGDGVESPNLHRGGLLHGFGRVLREDYDHETLAAIAPGEIAESQYSGLATAFEPDPWPQLGIKPDASVIGGENLVKRRQFGLALEARKTAKSTAQVIGGGKPLDGVDITRAWSRTPRRFQELCPQS